MTSIFTDSDIDRVSSSFPGSIFSDKDIDKIIDVGAGMSPDISFGEQLTVFDKSDQEIVLKAIDRGQFDGSKFPVLARAEQAALLRDLENIGEVDESFRKSVSLGRDEKEKENILLEQARLRDSSVLKIRDKKGNVINHLIVDNEGNKQFFDLTEKNIKDVLDFYGDFLETTPGVAGSLVAGVKGGAIGDAFGTFLRSIAAKAEGSGETEALDELIRGAQNVILGLFGEAVTPLATRGVGSAIKPIGRKVVGRRAARQVGQRAEDFSDIGGVKKTATFLQESEDLEKRISESIAEEFRFTPGQAVGSTDLLAAEARLAKRSKTARSFAQAKIKQSKQAAKFLDNLTDKISANPSLIGKRQTADLVGRNIVEWVEGVKGGVRSSSKPFYDIVDGSGLRITNDNTVTTINRLLNENKFTPSLTKEINSNLKAIKSSTKDGGMLISDFQNLRSSWIDIGEGKIKLLEGLDRSKQNRIARQVLDAIESDLVAAEKRSASKPVIEALRKGNAIWAEGMQSIRSTVTGTVNKLVRDLTGESGDAAIEKILRMSESQIEGLSRAAEKASPGSAAQLRAELFENILRQEGKPITRSPSFAAEEGVDQLNIRGAIKRLAKNEQKLRALFGGDPESLIALQDSFRLLQRLEGKPTFTILKEPNIFRTTLRDVPGAGVLETSWDALKLLFRGRDAETAMHASMSTPKGMDVFRSMLRAELEHTSRTGLTPRTAKTLFSAGIRLANSPEFLGLGLPSELPGEGTLQ